MKTLFFIFLGFATFLALFHFSTRKYLNPYKLIMVFGKKGAGKTTLLTKLAIKAIKQGKKVYCTERIKGTYYIPYEDIGYYEIPPESLLLIDEVGMIWDNRQFKNFKPEVRDWFKLQRHRHITVYMFSQTFDVDKKLRDLTDAMYLVENRLRVFSYAKKIRKATVLNNSTAEAPSKIDENLEFEPFLFFWCGSRKFTFLPKYAKYFDSFYAPELLHKEYEVTP